MKKGVGQEGKSYRYIEDTPRGKTVALTKEIPRFPLRFNRGITFVSLRGITFVSLRGKYMRLTEEIPRFPLRFNRGIASVSSLGISSVSSFGISGFYEELPR